MRTRTDPRLILMLIGFAGGMTALSILAPLVYLWVSGMAACVGIFVLTGMVLGGMDFLWFVFVGPDVVRGALYLIGAILKGLVSLSTGASSD